MISLLAARELLGSELEPGAIVQFVRTTPQPLAALRVRRLEIADTWTHQLVPGLSAGEIRPFVHAMPGHIDERVLDSVWSSLLYSHSAAISDPLASEFRTVKDRKQEQDETLRILHFLAVLAPLIDAGTVVLVPDDLLPDVKMRVSRYGLDGFVSALIEGAEDRDSEFHPESVATKYLRQLEWLASTGWAVHIDPIRFDRSDMRERYVTRRILRAARTQFWLHHLRSVTLGSFDSFALRTLTAIPVPDLADLRVSDIRGIREEDAFGAWRLELAAVIAEYKRNLGTTSLASAIATERLTAKAIELERTIVRSSALSAFRSGLSTFGISGSAVLAAFPLLSVSGRTDGMSLAAGTSLLKLGERLVFHERFRRSELSLVEARRNHYVASARIFRARSARLSPQRAR